MSIDDNKRISDIDLLVERLPCFPNKKENKIKTNSEKYQYGTYGRNSPTLIKIVINRQIRKL
jgi:hypothetical protein